MTEQFYKSHIFCCTNERPAGHARGSCKGRGADDIRNYMKSRVKEEGIAGARVNGAGCLDRCELGPVVVVYPEGIWYKLETREDVDAVIDSHLKNGVPVERLMLKNDQK